tara:strand:- start:9540 stop:9830 length:291 start_codon:yes stop_codon:yes gene_type:complete
MPDESEVGTSPDVCRKLFQKVVNRTLLDIGCPVLSIQREAILYVRSVNFDKDVLAAGYPVGLRQAVEEIITDHAGIRRNAACRELLEALDERPEPT